MLQIAIALQGEMPSILRRRYSRARLTKVGKMSQPPKKSGSSSSANRPPQGGSKSGSGSSSGRPANKQSTSGGSGKASKPVSSQPGGSRPPVTRQPVGKSGRYAQPEKTGFMASVDRVLPPFSAQRYVAIWVLGM